MTPANTYYSLRCDRCRRYYEDSEGERVLLENLPDLVDEATDNGWAETESGRHFCPDCWSPDVTDENIIIKPTIPQNIWDLMEFTRYCTSPRHEPEMTETYESWIIKTWIDDEKSVPQGFEDLCRHVLANNANVHDIYCHMEVNHEVEKEAVNEAFYRWVLKVTVDKPNKIPAENTNLPQSIIKAKQAFREEIVKATGVHIPNLKTYMGINGRFFQIMSKKEIYKGIEIDGQQIERNICQMLQAKKVLFFHEESEGVVWIDIHLQKES